jgi:hypothetical protein
LLLVTATIDFWHPTGFHELIQNKDEHVKVLVQP